MKHKETGRRMWANPNSLALGRSASIGTCCLLAPRTVPPSRHLHRTDQTAPEVLARDTTREGGTERTEGQREKGGIPRHDRNFLILKGEKRRDTRFEFVLIRH